MKITVRKSCKICDISYQIVNLKIVNAFPSPQMKSRLTNFNIKKIVNEQFHKNREKVLKAFIYKNCLFKIMIK